MTGLFLDGNHLQWSSVVDVATVYSAVMVVAVQHSKLDGVCCGKDFGCDSALFSGLGYVEVGCENGMYVDGAAVHGSPSPVGVGAADIGFEVNGMFVVRG